MSLLKIKNISHYYGNNQVIDSLELKAKEGEVTCLLGPSGCGKSTLLRLVAGLEKLSYGEIIAGNKNISNPKKSLPPEKRGMGMVFQNPSLFPHLNVFDNVAFGIKAKTKKDKIVKDALKSVSMERYIDRFPHELSGGQQQRVALARALAPKPKIVLLDEPFANLDSVLRKRIREETTLILKELGVTTLLVTHDPEEALRMADKIYVMQNGGVVQSGTAQDLYNTPKNSFIASFFGELDRMKVLVKGRYADTIFGPVDLKKVACENIGDSDCKLMPDGTSATMLIRPEAMKVHSSARDDRVEVKVEDIKFLGLANLLYVRTKDGELLKVRTSKNNLPKINKKVYLQLDERQVFIFAEDN